MCGLFGWVGRDPRSFNKQKLDILGIMNETRGKHSCGISTDGTIRLGTDDNKIYRKFLEEVNYNVPSEHGVVIGHTRHATGGAHNKDNSHPFGFGTNENGDFEFIGAHNGSLLHDYKDLATKRNIPVNVETKRNNATVTRSKIDSEILLEALYVDDDYTVLSEYNGAAALIWYKTNDPNTMYIFHGATPEDKFDKDLWVERPLFVYQESKYSLYISSLEESLKVIGGTDDTITNVPCNKVFKIKNGNFAGAEVIDIDREGRYNKTLYIQNYKKNKKKSSNFTPTCGNTNRSSNNTSRSRPRTNGSSVASRKLGNYNVGNANISNKVLKHGRKMFKKSPKLSIYNISVDQNTTHGRVYESNLRFWRNGRPIEGIYAWVPTYGYFKMGDTEKEAREYFHNCVDKPFLDGHFGKLRDDIPAEKLHIPFKSLKSGEFPEIEYYYFFKGIRVRTLIDFSVLKRDEKEGTNMFGYDNISIAASHPIIDLTRYKEATDQQIMWDNELFSGTLNILGSNHVYHIDDGNLIGIEIVNEDNPVAVSLNGAFKNNTSNVKVEVIDTVDEIEFEELDDEDIENIDQRIENDELEKEIDNVFMQPFTLFPDQAKGLRKNYPNNERATTGARILEKFVREASDLLAVDKES